MTDETDGLVEAELHIAGTRPWMMPVINLPWTVLACLTGITAELLTLHWKLALFSAPLWPIALWVFSKDHNGLRLLGAWMSTSCLDLCASWFGATSLEVFSTAPAKKFRGIPNG